MFNAEQDIKKWAPVLEHADAPAIQDNYRKAVTATFSKILKMLLSKKLLSMVLLTKITKQLVL